MGGGDQLGDDVTVDIGEAEISTIEAVGKLFMIQTAAVKQGRMQIVNVDPAFDRSIADFVGHSHVSAASDVSVGALINLQISLALNWKSIRSCAK